MAVHHASHRFTVDEYHRMADAGIFTEDDRVELLNGEIVQMAAIGSRHAACVKRLIHDFSHLLSGRAIVSAQDPVLLNQFSEPEPDVALLRPRADFYASGHPMPDDLFLVVEVADSTFKDDKTKKVPVYALAAVPEVWLVNLAAHVVEVYRHPEGGRYLLVSTLSPGEVISPGAFPDVTIEVGPLVR